HGAAAPPQRMKSPSPAVKLAAAMRKIALALLLLLGLGGMGLNLAMAFGLEWPSAWRAPGRVTTSPALGGPSAGAAATARAPYADSSGAPRWARGQKPILAILIDDWGYDWAAADGFLQLPPAITVSVLPELADSVNQARAAAAAGHEVLLHLPMQPQDPDLKLSPGAIRVAMTDAEILATVARDIAAVPGIIGINNHEGSAATADARVMRAVVGEARAHGLFFVDSRTTAKTAVPAVDRELGLPYYHNTLFIDNVGEREAIERRLEQAAAQARRSGVAVVIGHVRPATLAAIQTELPRLAAAGIKVVPLSVALAAQALRQE
ncbi:MAG TPA: divergent polysaccharide deacetylase family protein, partial [Limnochordia bacterium]|nr:divergent polysaccharide deacetylase family protein [Limnochordia bacterium]